MKVVKKMEKILLQHFVKIENLKKLQGGNINQIFEFTAQNKPYILRLNPNFNAFDKSEIIAKMLNKKIVAVRNFGEGSYMITEKIHGNPVASMTLTDKLRHSVMEKSLELHEISVDNSHGYGFIGDDGNGTYESWEDFVEKFFSREGIGDFWKNWYNLFDEGILERDVFNELYGRLRIYAEFNSDHRYFVHGDLHGANILAKNDSVTGFIDFDNGMYGDFLIDVATVDRVVPVDELKKFYAKSGMNVENFEARYLGAKYFKGLDILRFYAKMKKVESYESLKKYLLALPE